MNAKTDISMRAFTIADSRILHHVLKLYCDSNESFSMETIRWGGKGGRVCSGLGFAADLGPQGDANVEWEPEQIPWKGSAMGDDDWPLGQ